MQLKLRLLEILLSLIRIRVKVFSRRHRLVVDSLQLLFVVNKRLPDALHFFQFLLCLFNIGKPI